MSNSSFPWFPFYVRDWLTDVKVAAMSCAARGAYIHLLALQWENGGLPPAWEDLAAMTGYQDGYEELERQLGSLFPPTDDGLRNPRLEELREEKIAKRAAQSAGGKSSHQAGKRKVTTKLPEGKPSVRASSESSSLPPEEISSSEEDIEPSSSLPSEEKSDGSHPLKGGVTPVEGKKTTTKKENVKGYPFPKAFLKFWDLYPERNGKRLGKRATYSKFAKIPASELDDLYQAAKNYSQSKLARVDDMAKDPQRFFINDYWRDWIDGPGTDEHIEERDKPRPAPQAPQGGPPASPDDVAAELGHQSFLEATRALSMEERLKKEEGK